MYGIIYVILVNKKKDEIKNIINSRQNPTLLSVRLPILFLINAHAAQHRGKFLPDCRCKTKKKLL